MREKTLCLIITFHTTTAAIAMERLCQESGLPGRLIPVPREITAGCGMAWKAAIESRGELVAAAKDAGIDIDGAYELVI
ncbi:MAG: DUF3343 domain-containing protein [Christensenellales bacterium]